MLAMLLVAEKMTKVSICMFAIFGERGVKLKFEEHSNLSIYQTDCWKAFHAPAMCSPLPPALWESKSSTDVVFVPEREKWRDEDEWWQMNAYVLGTMLGTFYMLSCVSHMTTWQMRCDYHHFTHKKTAFLNSFFHKMRTLIVFTSFLEDLVN